MAKRLLALQKELEREMMFVERKIKKPPLKIYSSIVFWNIGVAGTITKYFSALKLPESHNDCIVVIFGDAPKWLYGYALQMLKDNGNAGAIAMFDYYLGAVVIESHIPDLIQGDIVAIGSEKEEELREELRQPYILYDNFTDKYHVMLQELSVGVFEYLEKAKVFCNNLAAKTQKER
jgi:CRISPR-associated Csx3 family protein